MGDYLEWDGEDRVISRFTKKIRASGFILIFDC